MKLVNSHILASLDADAQGMKLRADSAGAFFERDLERILSTTLEQKRAPLDGFRLFSVNTGELSPGASTFVARHLSRTGRAKRIGNYADDLPLASMSVGEERFAIQSYGVAASYSVQDVLAAAEAGVSLPAEQIQTAREVGERRMHEVLWDGDAEAGLWGVFGHPLIPRSTMANRIDGGTADDVIADINAVVTSIVDRTNGAQPGPFRIVMPIEHYNYIATQPRSTQSDTTILEFLLRNPAIESINPSWATKGKGDSDLDCMVVYPPAMPQFMVGKPVGPEPVQRKNLALLVPMYGRTGGLYVPYPQEMEIAQIPAA